MELTLHTLKNFLTKNIKYNHILKRNMMSGKSIFVVRAAYYFAINITNSDMLHQINKNNTQPIAKSFAELALNDTLGVLQHKTALVKHATTQQFPAEYFYDAFSNVTGTNIVRPIGGAFVDARVLNEIGSIQEYFNTFGKLPPPYAISDITATCDKVTSNLPHQKQPNVDFLTRIDRGMGLTHKIVYQDDKSGMDIIKHSLRGSIGILSYDGANKNIPITTNPIELETIITINKQRMDRIRLTLTGENLETVFEDAINNGYYYCNNITKKDLNTCYKLHNEFQDLLWKDFQCHPQMQRSVSFIFLKKIIDTPMTPQEETFSTVFRSNLDDRIYSLDKRQDFNQMYTAIIKAGKTIDPQFITKLEYIHNNGLSLHTPLLTLLTSIIKNGI